MYPLHMPGHKRRLMGEMPKEFYQADITEINGFDNLHEPEEIFVELQEKVAKLCGAKKSYFLVNGSTCGVLAAISACLPKGGHLLMARNAHKSAYHAAYLRELKVTYLWPEFIPEYPIYEAITPMQVEKALEKDSTIQAVFLVSPTYEGRIADIRAIADCVHKHDRLLIVDEAHGAHLGFDRRFAQNSVVQGADIVIQSTHKTLPAPTQTAILHVNGDRVPIDLLERFLHIYQTSSPSYLLLSGIENAYDLVEKEGAQLFERFYQNWIELLHQLEACRVLRFLPRKDDRNHDIGKLIMDTGKTMRSGQWLFELLLEKYHLQLEMAAGSYCLAMFTIGDTEEGYERLAKALLEIDEMLLAEQKTGIRANLSASLDAEFQNTPRDREDDENALFKAWDCPKVEIPLEKAEGRVAGEFINLYPPGFPILVPGEQISATDLEQLQKNLADGLHVQGIVKKQANYFVKVVSEKI